uniref:Uncharacterized protein n=1 Tax=Bionectria ochroleuca TaxID=29856 RepID=A0A8H7NA04_BIOOC
MASADKNEDLRGLASIYELDQWIFIHNLVLGSEPNAMYRTTTMSHWVMVAVGLVSMIAPTAQSGSTSVPTSISLPVRFPLNVSGVAASVVAIESGQTTVSFECHPSVTAEVCSPDVDRRIMLGPLAPDEPNALGAYL